MCKIYNDQKPLKLKPFNIRNFLYKLNESNYGYATPFVNEVSLSNFLSRANKSDDFYILEATYEHDQDIKYLYEKIKPFAKQFVDNFKDYLEQHEQQKKVLMGTIESTELPSDLAKQANKKNPVTITFGVYGDNCFYSHHKKHIHINFVPGKLLHSLVEEKRVIDNFVVGQIKEIIFTELRISIAHELTHWLDESLKGAISKYIGFLNKKYDEKDISKAQWDYLRSYIEIQGSVHDVKQLKQEVGDEQWNKMTFKQMFDRSGLSDVADEIRSDEQALTKWKKQIFKRLAREELIGNNMRSKEFSGL